MPAKLSAFRSGIPIFWAPSELQTSPSWQSVLPDQIIHVEYIITCPDPVKFHSEMRIPGYLIPVIRIQNDRNAPAPDNTRKPSCLSDVV